MSARRSYMFNVYLTQSFLRPPSLSLGQSSNNLKVGNFLGAFFLRTRSLFRHLHSIHLLVVLSSQVAISRPSSSSRSLLPMKQVEKGLEDYATRRRLGQTKLLPHAGGRKKRVSCKSGMWTWPFRFSWTLTSFFWETMHSPLDKDWAKPLVKAQSNSVASFRSSLPQHRRNSVGVSSYTTCDEILRFAAPPSPVSHITVPIVACNVSPSPSEKALSQMKWNRKKWRNQRSDVRWEVLTKTAFRLCLCLTSHSKLPCEQDWRPIYSKGLGRNPFKMFLGASRWLMFAIYCLLKGGGSFNWRMEENFGQLRPHQQAWRDYWWKCLGKWKKIPNSCND